MKLNGLFSLIMVLALFACKKSSEEDTTYLFIPSSFSPNGDGNNDELIVTAWDYSYDPEWSAITDFTFTVYNFDNIQLFQTKDVNTGWDGTYKNKEVPTGTYIYIVEADRANGNKNLIKGYVGLVR